jgi:hypothetical protein
LRAAWGSLIKREEPAEILDDGCHLGADPSYLDRHTQEGVIEMEPTAAVRATTGTGKIAEPSFIPVAESSPPDILIGAGAVAPSQRI